ncbi:MAG: GyrI-like domain-containing protein [Phycisphaerales bacterium JB043]
MKPTEDEWCERIGLALRLLEERLGEDVSLEELAQAASYSMFHFHRLFRGLMGESVREYSRRLLLERAAHHLTHGDNDILHIALDAGYDSHEAFTRAFKERFGVTPSLFREERREVHSQRARSTNETPIDIRIEKRSAARIACVRHVGPYDQVGSAWAKLMKWGWTKMVFGKPDTFGLCFDDPDITPGERVRYEACMVVDAKAKPKGDIEIREIPASSYAVTVHEGSFQTIGLTYSRLFARIATGPIDNTNCELGDPPSLEKYLADPRKIKPEDMRTEIWMPVC